MSAGDGYFAGTWPNTQYRLDVSVKIERVGQTIRRVTGKMPQAQSRIENNATGIVAVGLSGYSAPRNGLRWIYLIAPFQLPSRWIENLSG